MIENKLLPRHFFGGYIFDIARRDPCRSLKLFESLVEALLALELQAFCESVLGISQFVFRWIAAGRGGRTLRTGQQHGVRLVRAEAKCCERQHRGKQYPQTHAQIVTGNSDEKEISIGECTFGFTSEPEGTGLERRKNWVWVAQRFQRCGKYFANDEGLSP